MKPDWSDAPEWADYLAQDANGTWYWYEGKPKPVYGGDWDSCEGKRYTFAGQYVREPEPRP